MGTHIPSRHTAGSPMWLFRQQAPSWGFLNCEGPPPTFPGAVKRDWDVYKGWCSSRKLRWSLCQRGIFMLPSFPSLLQLGLPHQPHTHTQACAQSTTREGSCDRSLPVAYWCYRTKQFVLRDFTSRIRMTTRGLGVSRSVCKNALHLHLDCSELFWNRITDKCSETGNSLTFKPKKPSLNSKVEY